MRTIKLPDNTNDTVWRIVLLRIWTLAFASLDLDCVDVWLQKSTVVVYDPHKHLSDPEIREELREAIEYLVEPGMAKLTTAALLGD